jgi:hypothetical protein
MSTETVDAQTVLEGSSAESSAADVSAASAAAATDDSEEADMDMCELPPTGERAAVAEAQKAERAQRAAAEAAAFAGQTAALAAARRRYRLSIEYCAECGSASTAAALQPQSSSVSIVLTASSLCLHPCSGLPRYEKMKVSVNSEDWRLQKRPVLTLPSLL